MPMVLAELSSFSSVSDRNFAFADDRMEELADLVSLRKVGVEIVLAVEAATSVDFGVERHSGANRLADALGIREPAASPASPRRSSATCVFGSAPNTVEAPEKSFDAVAVICAWTSRPTTTSQSPVAPLMR